MMLTDPMGDNNLRESVGTALFSLVCFGVGVNFLNFLYTVIRVTWHKWRLRRLRNQSKEKKEQKREKRVTEEIKSREKRIKGRRKDKVKDPQQASK